ncbi:MAG: acyl carrier protein [Calditrichaceae bacterium]
MEIRDQLVHFFNENFMVDMVKEYSADTSLLENGIIDSTGVLELVAYIEQNYSIKINDEEIVPENLDSLINIENFIKNKVNGKK